MVNRLTNAEMLERGYTDVVVNLPLEEIGDDIKLESIVRHPSEIIIIYDCASKKATFYISKEDFEARGGRK